MNTYRELEGEKGELFVYSIVEKVLKRMDYRYGIARNSILPFDSVYGEKGYITAEFDIIVFTPFFVFLFEIKNEFYNNYDYQEPLWKLANNQMVSNPITQNHTHKQVFCSEFNIPREKVITVEILLKNGKLEMQKSPFVNDYIFDTNELEQKLQYLFATESECTMNNVDLFAIFEKKIQEKHLTREEHIRILKDTEKIETRIKRVCSRCNLRRTDIIRCNSCESGILRFRKLCYPSTKKNKRASGHYALGCSNYGNTQINCEFGLVYVDKDKPIDLYLEMEAIHIEDRNNWGKEKVVKTVLDEINDLKEQNIRMAAELKKAKTEMTRVRNQVQNMEKEYISTKNEIGDLREKIKHFKKVIACLYVYRD